MPLKSPGAAKSRLSAVLDPARRRDLFYCMARHVIGALMNASCIQRVAVVTASAEVADFARSLGTSVIPEEHEAGTAAACRIALAAASGRTDGLVFASGDLPLATPAAFEPLLTRAGRSPFAAIVPDRRRAGTNVLMCVPADVLPVRFGPGSFQQHVAACPPGIALEVVESDALSLDIDDAGDLLELQTRLSASTAPALCKLRELLMAGGPALVQ